VVSHDPDYHDGKLLKFELLEDEGVRAPQDSVETFRKDTPLAQKFTGIDRQLTAAAEMAKSQPKGIYSVTMEFPSERKALEELVQAKAEAKDILRMTFIETKVRMKAPWLLTLYFEVTEKQAELLKQHYPTGTMAYIGKATVETVKGTKPSTDGKKKTTK
jgi:hypothetical protein